MNLIFHDAKKERPPKEKWSAVASSREFLVRTKWGSWFVWHYADGWNCCIDHDGYIYKDHKIGNQNVVMWAELPRDIPCEDCIEDCPVKEDE